MKFMIHTPTGRTFPVVLESVRGLYPNSKLQCMLLTFHTFYVSFMSLCTLKSLNTLYITVRARCTRGLRSCSELVIRDSLELIPIIPNINTKIRGDA
jgi:hypothetical protein